MWWESLCASLTGNVNWETYNLIWIPKKVKHEEKMDNLWCDITSNAGFNIFEMSFSL